MKKNKVTIVTPTYNRENTLPRLYDSLTKQTSKDFEWLVIDDGSEDLTKELIHRYKSQQKISIEYVYKANGGKHTALNLAFDLIKSDTFFIVDSDDYLLPCAVEEIKRDFEENKSEEIYAINYLKSDYSGAIIGDKFIKDEYIDSYIEGRINSNVYGDKLEVWKTSLFEDKKFPVFVNENFIGEAMLWLEASMNRKMMFKNKVLYRCEYLDGGLSSAGRSMRVNNPMGGMAHANAFLIKDIRPKIRVKNALLYNTYSNFLNIGFRRRVKDANSKIYVILMYVPSFILYMFWKFKN